SKENTENKNDITDNDTQNNNETHQPSVEISEPSVITETSVHTSSQPSSNNNSIQESSEESTGSTASMQGHTSDTSTESEPSAPSDTSVQTNPLITIPSPDGLDYTFNTNNNTLTIIGEGTITGSFSDFDSHTAQKIKTVIIGSKVTGIGYRAFDSCESLETVKMGDNLTSIEGSAFLGCTALKEIHLSNSLNELGDAVFNGCTSLQEITVPEQVTKIENDTFTGCTALKAIHMSKNIKEINDNAFTDCNKDILTIYAPKGSHAQTYADNNKIKFTEEGIAVEDSSAADSSVT
ncbi:MAG: leucine-rich repeat domain-containing protein, partial [Clostridia bacterium]|nr:leucine-rich repeat domain-containing protein [Clostridia bacterium]